MVEYRVEVYKEVILSWERVGQVGICDGIFKERKIIITYTLWQFYGGSKTKFKNKICTVIRRPCTKKGGTITNLPQVAARYQDQAMLVQCMRCSPACRMSTVMPRRRSRSDWRVTEYRWTPYARTSRTKMLLSWLAAKELRNIFAITHTFWFHFMKQNFSLSNITKLTPQRNFLSLSIS